MDTSNSTKLTSEVLQFTIKELYQSPDPAEQVTAKMAERTIEAFIRQLKPILRHVAKPIIVEREQDGCLVIDKKFRAVELGSYYAIGNSGRTHVFLLSDGSGAIGDREAGGESIKRFCFSEVAWRFCVFGEVLKTLQSMLADAKAKCDAHSAAVGERHGVVTAMLCIAENRGIQD